MKLLTIAIPTYNRSQFLATCLDQIVKQLPGFEDDVEVIVSDNCSTDDTPKIVAGFVEQSPVVRSMRNATNIGADSNFIQCFEKAESTYVMIIGDDDVLLDGGLAFLLMILKREQFSSVFLRGAGFFADFRTEVAVTEQRVPYIVYDNAQKFIKKINVDATFISSNIVNKARLPKDIDIRQFNGTSLVQLGWILPSIIYSERCLYVDRVIIAGRAFNSGGFRFFDVFAVNLHKIIYYYKQHGIDKKTYNYFVKKLLVSFYPNRIYSIRSNNELYDDKYESIYNVLHKIFKYNLLFWIFVVPAIFLPVNIVNILNKFINKCCSLSVRFINLIK